ncbi:hypothetical protein SLEP1_g5114 [Rubroshorea leprosula]|uniref:Uncharacterized protein n=1 Tax=Rubroshorea leprosula TaxID=152421 RepID=A0AAV5I0H6_9ROSI|nr:hypothetical protein SLEP1_g5114 [Rubroshorea leprosula]
MWRAVPCTNRACVRTESRQDIEEILKAKLATIKEEPAEMMALEEIPIPPRTRRCSRGRRFFNKAKKKMGRRSHLCLHNSYMLFITGFASKATFAGLLVQY